MNDSTAGDQFTPTDIPRDRLGRPLVLPPGGGKKRIAYRRVTTFVNALSDTYGLQLWKQRQVAIGLGQRPDLVLAAAAADPNDKNWLDEIVQKAVDHSTAAATTGTALHSLTERLDRGLELGVVPEPYGADLKAYQEATRDIEWTDIESFRVLDGWEVAGTCDRIGRIGEHLVVADIKSGKLDFPSAVAMQIACYAHCLPYDIAGDQRGPATPGLSLDYGVVIHLPAGEGHCQLYRIDIARGWDACLLAHKVWTWRTDSKKGLLEILDPANGIEPTLIDLAAAADSVERLRELWYRAKREGSLDETFLAMCEARRGQLAADPKKTDAKAG